MFDGHNLFLDRFATFGTSWNLKAYLEDNDLDLIVVGVECSHVNKERLKEYCPLLVPESSWIAPLDSYGIQTGEWMVNTLKPFIEKHYRVYKRRADVGIGGSSMGGLMGLYMITRYNSLFSKACCLSPTLDIDFEQLIDLLDQYKLKQNTRIYLDFGSSEVKNKKTMAQCMDRLLTVNYILTKNGATTFPNIVVGGRHNEATWGSLAPLFIPYLYQELYEE